jgi:hypothetical protein
MGMGHEFTKIGAQRMRQGRLLMAIIGGSGPVAVHEGPDNIYFAQPTETLQAPGVPPFGADLKGVFIGPVITESEEFPHIHFVHGQLAVKLRFGSHSVSYVSTYQRISIRTCVELGRDQKEQWLRKGPGPSTITQAVP